MYTERLETRGVVRLAREFFVSVADESQRVLPPYDCRDKVRAEGLIFCLRTGRFCYEARGCIKDVVEGAPQVL